MRKKAKLLGFLAVLLLLIQLSFSMEAFAAEGKLTIALSTDNVSVGNTVTVTLRAAGPNGEGATSDMEFTYNSNILDVYKRQRWMCPFRLMIWA